MSMIEQTLKRALKQELKTLKAAKVLAKEAYDKSKEAFKECKSCYDELPSVKRQRDERRREEIKQAIKDQVGGWLGKIDFANHVDADDKQAEKAFKWIRKHAHKVLSDTADENDELIHRKKDFYDHEITWTLHTIDDRTIVVKRSRESGDIEVKGLKGNLGVAVCNKLRLIGADSDMVTDSERAEWWDNALKEADKVGDEAAGVVFFLVRFANWLDYD